MPYAGTAWVNTTRGKGGHALMIYDDLTKQCRCLTVKCHYSFVAHQDVKLFPR